MLRLSGEKDQQTFCCKLNNAANQLLIRKRNQRDENGAFVSVIFVGVSDIYRVQWVVSEEMWRCELLINHTLLVYRALHFIIWIKKKKRFLLSAERQVGASPGSITRIGAVIAVESQSWLFMFRPCSLFGHLPHIAVVMTSSFQCSFVIFDVINWCHYFSSTKTYLNFPFNRLNHTSHSNFRESNQSTSR